MTLGGLQRTSLGTRLPRAILITSSTLILITFFVLLGLAAWQKRAQTVAEAARTTQNLARTIEEHALRSFHEADVMLSGLVDLFEEQSRHGPLDVGRMQTALRAHAQLSRQYRNLAVIDAAGNRLIGGTSGVGPLDVSDRDYFTALRDDPEIDFYVSRPFFSRVANAWSLGFSRRLHRPDGGFDGVVVAIMDLNWLQSFYAALDVGQYGNITLWDATASHVLARYPANAKLLGQSFDVGPLFEQVRGGQDAGTFQSVSPLDGIERVVSYRRVAGMPFVVSVALAEEDVLKANRHLQRSEARFRDYAETASDWYWETDSEHRFSYVSDRIRAYLDPQHLIGRRRTDVALDKGEDAAKWREHLALLDRHEAFSDFVYRYDARREGRYCCLSGKPLFDDSGRFLGYRGTTRDVTEIIRAQERLREALLEAEAANRAKSEFLAGMSHELRTPLNAIIGFSDILRSGMAGAVSPKVREYAEDINQSGQHLLKMINDILEISRIEAGALGLNEAPTDIREAIALCARLIGPRAAEGRLRLAAVLRDDLPPLFIDETRLKQILLNLLSNAVKFTRPGGSVTVEAGPREDGAMVIAIRDSGIGMTAAELDIAMQPFRQVDSSLARRAEGTGLGLPLTKAFVELHGGTLELDSTPGAGTTARVIFPRERVLQQAA